MGWWGGVVWWVFFWRRNGVQRNGEEGFWENSAVFCIDLRLLSRSRKGWPQRGAKKDAKKGEDGGDEGMGKTDFALQRLVLRMFEKRG